MLKTAKTNHVPLVPYRKLNKPGPWYKELDATVKLVNFFLLLLIKKRDIANLEKLFQQDTDTFLRSLESQPQYVINNNLKNSHKKNFPIKYNLSSPIADVVICYVYNFAASDEWQQQEKCLLIELLLRNGAKFTLALQYALAMDVSRFVNNHLLDPNISHYGYSLLHITTRGKLIEKVVEDLLKKGTNPNFNCDNDMNGCGTALHVKIANENVNESLKLIELIKTSYNPNLQDAEGKTPLLLAAKIRKAIILKALILHFKEKIDVNKPDKSGRTPLHFACAYGDLESVQTLLTEQPEVNAKDNLGYTPLDYAHMKAESIQELLLSIEIHPERDANASVNAVLDSNDDPYPSEGKLLLATRANLKKLQEKLTGFRKYQCMPEDLIKAELTHLKRLNKVYQGKTVLNACLEGQDSVKPLLLKAGGKRSGLAVNKLCVVENQTNEMIASDIKYEPVITNTIQNNHSSITSVVQSNFFLQTKEIEAEVKPPAQLEISQSLTICSLKP